MKHFALAGNPNSGKTTLFNALTGSTAHVGNWPGVTVDKLEGTYKKLEEPIALVDLPGIYSLSPYTSEEIISRNYILDEKPDCVINIVDATNLERNLYLTTQLMEIDVPIVIALNMMDIIRKDGTTINISELEKKIGLPVVEVSALKEENLDELMKVAYKASKTSRKACTVLEGTALTHLIKDVEIAFKGIKVDNPLFHAVKLIENDELEINKHDGLINVVNDFKATFNDEIFGTDFEAVIADARYKHITANYSPCFIRKDSNNIKKASKSDKIDKVMTNKWLGIPIFLVILFLIYHLTFSENFLYLGSIFNLKSLEELGLSAENNFFVKLLSCLYDGSINSPGCILFNLMDLITSSISELIVGGLKSIGSPDWVVGLIGDGILGGLCGVLSFVPQIVFLLLLFAILEDSGYMSRVAFILDRLFRKFGVSGRAFIPMIMGFGCSIPAMVNTRTLNNEREKTMTIRTIPFFTCGAKLPVLAAIAAVLANIAGLNNADVISFTFIVLGMIIAIVSIIIMNHTTQRGEIPPFIMELPQYHIPSARSLMIHTWDKTKHFIKKAFTIILASTIIIWFLSNFGWDWHMVDNMEESILASIGQLIQPIFTPLGFGSQLNSFGWVFAVAAITGLIAKENVIATFGALAAMTIFVGVDGGLSESIVEGANDVAIMMQGTDITWQGLVAFLVFNMTTIPCFAAVATAKSETLKGKFKWTLLFWVVLSYIVSSVVYVMLSWWWTSFIFVALFIIAIAIIYYSNKKLDKKKELIK